MNTSLSNIIILFTNILVFFGYGYHSGKRTYKKGFIEGIMYLTKSDQEFNDKYNTY